MGTTSRSGAMVGIVICGHGQMGAGMLHAAEMIGGPQPQLRAIEVAPGAELDRVSATLLAAIDEVDDGAGVLVLTDMPGGTPCNVTAPHLAAGRLEMITGFNLPALLKLLTARARPENDAAGDGSELEQLATLGAQYGQRHILTGAAINAGRRNS